MNTSQIQTFIQSLPLDDSDKSILLDDLSNNLPTKVVTEKISVMLAKKEKTLHESNPEAAKEYAEIDKEYEKDVTKAANDFGQAMDDIENEANEIDHEVSKQLDEARVEELKENLGQ